MGKYSYECDEHVAFSMTPAADMQSITVVPRYDSAYPPAGTLRRDSATTGVRFVGGSVVLKAKGESVTLGEGDSTINCSPVKNADLAPFNFGD